MKKIGVLIRDEDYHSLARIATEYELSKAEVIRRALHLLCSSTTDQEFILATTEGE